MRESLEDSTICTRFINADGVLAATPMPALIDAIDEAFRHPPVAPARHHHTMEVGNGEPDATMLLMPAWSPGEIVGIKVALVFPGANALNLPAVQATYLVSDGRSGSLLAVIDGSMMTARRTAAASAVAASYLARDDASTLLMVGTGAQAPHLIEAHCSVRPISKVLVWGRQQCKAEALVAEHGLDNITYEVISDLESAARSADVISCATMSEAPLIRGQWLKPGAHLDLVGGFKPTMRESDDDAVKLAKVFVDTREGALSEAGDIIQPILNGIMSETDIVGELSELCTGACTGRTATSDITLFKSVGASLEDFAAAQLILTSSI